MKKGCVRKTAKMNPGLQEIARLLKVIDRLQGPGGCPWDRAQTVRSLHPQLLEETYEVLAAINSLDETNLAEELGDLLFQILMVCRIAEKKAGIALSEIARGIEEKIVRRHPHVFGRVRVTGVDDVVRNWEKIKAIEKNRPRDGSIYHDTWKHLPALRRAQKVQGKARQAGFDWRELAELTAKIREELGEVEEEIRRGDAKRLEEEIGDLLFAITSLSRYFQFDAELALQRMVGRWVKRFQRMERLLKAEGIPLNKGSIDAMERIWGEIGEEGKNPRRAKR
ncbi:MAG: nucleoside triphosphate pyrophosphohydrolase [Candidatus Aureabacteria bacterium]|nr:nucleoside triphosphate pyrophosphohydrolase [Candidatus Auribacterota bacterium]